jgi:hypothetical protein
MSRFSNSANKRHRNYVLDCSYRLVAAVCVCLAVLQEYASAVSSLTAADVAKYIEEALKTPLTLVAVGSMSNLPKYDTVKSRLAA